jgi:hypothetical protein
MLSELTVGRLYSNDDIFRSLNLSNAGGIRVRVEADVGIRAAILTSRADLHVVGENPYYDRLEGEILTYTAAGKVGEQTLAGMNRRLIDQKKGYTLWDVGKSANCVAASSLLPEARS